MRPFPPTTNLSRSLSSLSPSYLVRTSLKTRERNTPSPLWTTPRFEPGGCPPCTSAARCYPIRTAHPCTEREGQQHEGVLGAGSQEIMRSAPRKRLWTSYGRVHGTDELAAGGIVLVYPRSAKTINRRKPPTPGRSHSLSGASTRFRRGCPHRRCLPRPATAPQQ